MDAQGLLQQSTDGVGTSFQVADLQIQIMDLQMEITEQGIDIHGCMKATFDNMYTVAAQHPPKLRLPTPAD